MVFAVQCPNQKCSKYMLVEDEQRGKVVACLICKGPIRAGSAGKSGERPNPRKPSGDGR